MSENNLYKNVKTNFDVIDLMTSRCKICFKNVKTSGNTTNLKKHLERNHSGLNIFSSIPMTSMLVPIDRVFIPDSIKNMETHKELEEQLEDDPSIFSGSETTLEFGCAVSSTPTTSVTPNKKRLIQMPINETFCSIESFSEGGTKYSKLSNALVFMIAKDGLPLNITEKGFQAYSKVATPLFKLPS
ncbi:uncharacterized protein LOC112691886 [Sipha flava]|uniref:Uncharacterized protein LOC112691886 n=1 Tax=Sipha flava TaxID=143950 RepID=A0A8B8GGU2_9HEMI|nr:uncharacterized protein LOC112691886 [Sipha flava]